MNGHRPQSPSSVENAPSPSKRPRLDGGQVNGQQMTPNGRAQSQGIPGQPNQQTNTLLMQHGINPRTLTPAQIHSLQAQNPSVQAKSLQVYNQNLAMHHSRSAMNNQGMPNGLMNPGVMPNQGDVMPMHDSQGMMPMPEYYANGQMAQMRPGMQTPGGQPGGGNHALQDYQMQLMMLEQQNKRRLMMARQEQDNIARADGQPGMVQQSLAPGTSPQGSRTGASPNPSEQMKRGTPKLPHTGLPGSPNVGDAMGQGRGSPASMNFGGGQMPPEMGGAAFFNMKPEGVVGPNGMRPPSSNPAFTGPQMTQTMDAMARPQPPGTANRMPGGNWQQTPQGQPMMAQQQPGQVQPGGTPQERNAMPPPQAPAAAGGAGRGQPPSPQPGTAAPPTPQQANKPPPKKKDTKDARKVIKVNSITIPCLKFCLLTVLFSVLQNRKVPQTQETLLQPHLLRQNHPQLQLHLHQLHPCIQIRSTNQDPTGHNQHRHRHLKTWHNHHRSSKPSNLSSHLPSNKCPRNSPLHKIPTWVLAI